MKSKHPYPQFILHPRFAALCLLAVILPGLAADAQTQGMNSSQGIRANYSLASVGPHKQVWADQAGVRRIAQVGTGMNYLDPATQQWTPSVPAFQVEGSAFVAKKLHYNVSISSQLNVESAIITKTPEGVTFGTTPLGLGLFDPVSGNFALIAPLTNCTGVQTASNVVVFENPFAGICGRLVYTAQKGAFHQDYVMTAAFDPAAWGFPAGSRIQIITECYGMPEPERIRRPIHVEKDAVKRSQMASPDLMDDVLAVGSYVFGAGRSYATTNSARGTRVGKQLVNLGNRWLLVESLPYQSVARELQALPPCGSTPGVGFLPKPQNAQAAYAAIAKPPAKSGDFPQPTVLLAKLDEKREPGLVIDYVANVGGTLSDPVVFDGGLTYFVSDPLFCEGATTIGQAVFKFPWTYYTSGTVVAGIELDSSLTLTTASYRPAIFTAGDDDTVGDSLSEIMSGYTGDPLTTYTTYGGYANGGPYLYWGGGANQTLSNLRFCYADQAVALNMTGSGYTIAHAQFCNCMLALQFFGGSGASGATITINNCLFTGVSDLVTENGLAFTEMAYSLCHCTFDNTAINSGEISVTPNFVDCIFANFPSAMSAFSGSYNGFYKGIIYKATLDSV